MKACRGVRSSARRYTAEIANGSLVEGFAVSYGVFQDYYINGSGPLKGDKRLAMVGVLSTGILYLGSPIVTVTITRFPTLRRKLLAVGLAIQIGALIAASFSNSTPQLIGTQGFLFGFGFVTLYIPLFSFTNEWFEKRRGLAYGLIYAATGIAGIPLPFILERLLYRYGAATTLRAYAVALMVLAGPTIFLVKPRLTAVNANKNATVIRAYGFLLRRKAFYIYCISSLFQGLGAYFPALFLPEYTTDLGMKTIIGAAMVVLYCFGQATGETIFGFLSDRVTKPDGLILLSSLPTSISTFVLWGFGKSAAPLAIYSVLFGMCAPAYSVLFARMGTALSNDPDTVLASYSVFLACKGLGNVLEGPLSQVLKAGPIARSQYASGAYAGIVWFTGTCLLVSAIVVFPLIKWRGVLRLGN